VKAVLGAMPDGVEVSRRRGKDHDVFVVINFSETKRIALPHTMKLLLQPKQAL